MIETWARPVEQILLTAAENKARTVGVVSPEANSGVTSLSHCIAEASARAGANTILVDLSAPVLKDAMGGWRIGDGTAQLIKRLPEKYSLLDVRPTLETRSTFNNVALLQKLITEELEAYDQIILDLPHLTSRNTEFVNPVGAARACDLLMMVCVPGRTTKGNLNQSVALLDGAGVKMGGLILNDVTNLTLGEQLSESAGRLSWLSRRLASWLQQRATSSDLLNQRT